MLDKAETIVKEIFKKVKLLSKKGIDKANLLTKKTITSLKKLLKESKVNLKEINIKIKEVIKKLNIKSRVNKLYKNLLKVVKAIKNYNYRNMKNDIADLFVKAKNYILDTVGSDKNADFVYELSKKTINMYAVCLLSFFVIAAGLASNLDFGYRVVCNGKTVAITAEKSVAISAYEDAVKELNRVETSDKVENTKIVFTIANREMFNNYTRTVNAVIAAYDGRENAYGIYADGVLVVAVNSEKEAIELLTEYKNEFSKEGILELDFNKKVEVIQSRVAKNDIKAKEDAKKILRQPAGGVKVYTVKEGETISEIAENAGTTTAKLMALNPGVSPETLQIGAKLNVSDNIPVIAVRTKEHTKEIEKIAYETNKVEDKNTYKGITIVVSDGEYGEKEVDYEVYKENGVVTGKIATSESILKEPVTKQVKVGSKARPATASTGKFMNPFAAGIVTSRYGSRSRGFHTGIDLAGRTGNPVYAADGGTVTFAGWSGGYGKMIKIRHDNGYETYYAHLSSINVSSGQKVAKGTQIGKVGNTGNSTGPHLHFEIRINGKSVNPGSYIGR